MKISIRASMEPVRGSNVHPLRWAFEKGAALGFDGLELCLGASYTSFSTFWTDEWKEGAKALIQEFRMPIFSLSSDWAWAYATFYPDLRRWKDGAGFLEEDAKLAHELGAHTILMHFATAKGSWADCKAAMKDVAAAGAAHGVTFGYEANIWNLINLGGFEGLLRMVDEVGSPHFGVYLHNAYPGSGLPLHKEVEQTGKRLVQAMHSSSLVTGQVQIDYPEAFSAMKATFADGAYTFEVPWSVAEENKKVIDAMIAKYW